MMKLLKVFVILTLISVINSRTVKTTKFNFNQVMMNDADLMMDDNNDNNNNQEDFKKCDELSQLMLNDILGAAFNSRFVFQQNKFKNRNLKIKIKFRYMSVDQPNLEEELERKSDGGKRGAQDFKPFYVDDTYAMEISDRPAWEVTHLQNSTEDQNESLESNNNSASTRRQRSNFRKRKDDQQQSKRPWECEAKIKWLDLGYDYYPRYLRTVECTRHSCFYGHFTCKPRSFTIKLLRRRRGECVQTRNRIGVEGLHGDLKELWVWEERAVNFCCDCAAK